MKKVLRRLFSPILKLFEAGDEPYTVKPLSRKILITIGVLFFGLASAVVYLSLDADVTGFMVPIVVFYGISLVALVVGLLGNDRAVARIWGNR
jgi:hypothetical protein